LTLDIIKTFCWFFLFKMLRRSTYVWYWHSL